ncbi:hypothetical protein C8J56DRAFT_1051260 [Mycena floridula]|nr:hypothetical protein C8J56DRAFT_1051260 [Mycena floridula]
MSGLTNATGDIVYTGSSGSTKPSDSVSLSSRKAAPWSHLPKFLHNLASLVSRLPDTVPQAVASDALAAFGGLPLGTETADELWEETVNRMLHRVCQGTCVDKIQSIIRRGENGMGGFLAFVAHVTGVRGISEVLFHEQVNVLTQAITSILGPEEPIEIDTASVGIAVEPRASVPSKVPHTPIDIEVLPVRF